MSFHQIIQSCDPNGPHTQDTITARATYTDPSTMEERSDELTVKLGALVEADASQLYKGDVVVNYAKAFIAISAMIDADQHEDAIGTAAAMVEWLELAEQNLGDTEIGEMAEIMSDYHGVLVLNFG